MSKRSVQIERLEIRLRGIKAETARGAIEHLDHALLKELAGGQLSATQNEGASVKGGNSDMPRRGEISGATALQKVIARKVAASVRERLK